MAAMLRDHRKGAISLTEPYEASSVQGGIEYIRDKRHETLDDAATFFDERHIWLEQFEQFVVVMRSSYELELSCFAYLLKDLPWDRGKAQELVLEGGFRQHLATALFFGMNPPGLDLYYHVEGHIPDNLVILRYEKLAAEIERHIASYLESGYEVPHENKSKHAPVGQVYDVELAALCYQRHKWFFDNGFYSRVTYPTPDALRDISQ